MVRGGEAYKFGIVVMSDLAKIDISSDGVFTFNVSSLDPGQYLFAVQIFWFPGNLFKYIPFLVNETTNINAEIDIPEDIELPATFDLGRVCVPLP